MDSCAYIFDEKDTASNNHEDTILACGLVKVYKKTENNRQIIDADDVLFGQSEVDIIASINRKRGLDQQLTFAFTDRCNKTICVTKHPAIIENVDEKTLIELTKKYGQLTVIRRLLPKEDYRKTSMAENDVPFPRRILYHRGSDSLLRHGVCEVMLMNKFNHAAIEYNPERAEQILKTREKRKQTVKKRRANVIDFIGIYDLGLLKHAVTNTLRWAFFLKLARTTWTEIPFCGPAKKKDDHQTVLLWMFRLMTAIFGSHSYRKLVNFQLFIQKYKKLNEKGIKKSKLTEEFKAFLDKEARAKTPKELLGKNNALDVLKPLKKINLSPEHIESIIL